ncbi:MAG TPA: hypothetical protein VGM17_10395, partial [Rhizomicrobium sp.]
MPLKFSFKVDPEGITVPYPPVTDEIRRNRGFIDLRGKPEMASGVEEGRDSPALHNLLARLARKDSLIFTIGCDLGTHQERTNVPARRREVAGGYVQFASIYYYRTQPQSYAALADAIGK